MLLVLMREMERERRRERGRERIKGGKGKRTKCNNKTEREKGN